MFNFENLFAWLNSNADIEPRSAWYQDVLIFSDASTAARKEAG